MAYTPLAHAVLRDIAHNIRSDHTMPLGKAKRLLDALYDADRAMTFQQKMREEEAARANGHRDLTPEEECRQLKETVAALRKELDTVRKQFKEYREGKETAAGAVIPVVLSPTSVPPPTSLPPAPSSTPSSTTPSSSTPPYGFCAICGKKPAANVHKAGSRDPQAHPFAAVTRLGAEG